jgi:hypothetical protein
MDTKPTGVAQSTLNIAVEVNITVTSPEEPINGRKVMKYKEAEHGDVYALPDKGGHITGHSKRQI